jgi:3-oxoacyl-[acyl-carrier protein] reductase
MMNIDLTHKIALVTGASGELGRVITRTLADCGADVAIHYHNSQAKAEALLDEVRRKGVRAMTVKADVTKADDVFAMQREVAAVLGDPDIIVNNAVIQYKWVHVLDQAIEDYESQFRSCVLHNVLMAKAFVPAMIRKRWGRVIALNTECAMQSTPNQSAYVSGKRGMDGVVRVLAREIGEHQITVNQVAPGWMISDKYRGESDDPRIIAEKEASKGYAQGVPLRRRGYDQDIANAVAFLASDLAAFITGAYIPVSGGNVMPTI